MAWWPFKRRAVPTPPETPPSPAAGGDSAEDWAVGDLAECIGQGAWVNQLGWPMIGPAFGEVHRVVQVTVKAGRQMLSFTRYGRVNGYSAVHFRKITPKADAVERADADFIASIRPKVAQ